MSHDSREAKDTPQKCVDEGHYGWGKWGAKIDPPRVKKPSTALLSLGEKAVLVASCAVIACFIAAWTFVLLIL